MDNILGVNCGLLEGICAPQENFASACWSSKDSSA